MCILLTGIWNKCIIDINICHVNYPGCKTWQLSLFFNPYETILILVLQASVSHLSVLFAKRKAYKLKSHPVIYRRPLLTGSLSLSQSHNLTCEYNKNIPTYIFFFFSSLTQVFSRVNWTIEEDHINNYLCSIYILVTGKFCQRLSQSILEMAAHPSLTKDATSAVWGTLSIVYLGHIRLKANIHNTWKSFIAATGNIHSSWLFLFAFCVR